MLPPRVALAKGLDDATCDRRWEELSSRYTHRSPADYGGLLSEWQALEKECGTTQRYKPRLALTYYYLDRPQDAKRVLASIGSSGQQESLTELVQILVDISLLSDAGKLDETALLQLEQRLQTFATHHPTDVVGMSLLADVISERGRFDVAIELYEKALSAIGPSRRAANLLRNLTVTYSRAHRYEAAYDTADKAITYNKDLLSDMFFVCAVARAQASIGKIENAKDTLTVLAVKNPEVKQQQEFKSAVAFVIEKSKSAGQH